MALQSKSEKNLLIAKTQQVILRTENLIEEFFNLIEKNYKFEKLVNEISDYYPDGDDKVRSVINAWVSVYNYCIKCHHTYISNPSGPEDNIQSFDVINATILNNPILKNSSKINTNNLDSLQIFFQGFLVSCHSTLELLVEEASTTLNVLFSYETILKDGNHFIKKAYIGSNKESVKIYNDKETIKIINQIKKTKLISRSPGNKIVEVMNRENNKIETIIQPMNQTFYDNLLVDIEKRLKPTDGWLNCNLIDFYGKYLESKEIKNIFVFHTSFSSKLFTFNNIFDYDSVKNHTRNVNIFKKQNLFIPINIKNCHWTLVAVNIQKK